MLYTLKQLAQITETSYNTLWNIFKDNKFATPVTKVGRERMYSEETLEKLKEYKKRKREFVKECSSICWDCKTNPSECMWLRFHVPIKGWKAKKVHNKDKNWRGLQRYIVLECPEFKREDVGK